MTTTKPTLADLDKALAANLDVMLQAPPPVDEPGSDVVAASAATPTLLDATAAQVLEESEATIAETEIVAPPVATGERKVVTTAFNESIKPHGDEPAQSLTTQVEEATTQTPPDAGHDAANDVAASSASIEPSLEMQPVEISLASAPALTPTSTLPVPAICSNTSAAAASPAIVDVSPMAPADSKNVAHSGNLFSAVKNLVLTFLALVGAPMQRVPAHFRPAMDWLAISLALWAPAVWVMVYMMHASAHNGPDAADAGKPAAGGASQHASAPIHEESVVQGH